MVAKPKVDKEETERLRKFNEQLRNREAPQPKPELSLGIEVGSFMRTLSIVLVRVIKATIIYFLAFLLVEQIEGPDNWIPTIGSQPFIIFVVIWPFIEQFVSPVTKSIPIIGPFFSFLDSIAMEVLRTKETLEAEIDAYNKDIVIDPQNAKSWNNKGIALFHLKRYEEALTCIDRALEIDPQLSIRRNKEDVLSELEKMKKQ
jgi:tetratricopeptide (TPR) repeat protein